VAEERAITQGQEGQDPLGGQRGRHRQTVGVELERIEEGQPEPGRRRRDWDDAGTSLERRPGRHRAPFPPGERYANV
jgi:hypothetical protein